MIESIRKQKKNKTKKCRTKYISKTNKYKCGKPVYYNIKNLRMGLKTTYSSQET